MEPGATPATPPLPRGADGFFHPSSEAEIQALVRYARARGLQARVRGSAHSIAEAIYTDAERYGRGEMVDLMLDRYAGLRFDDARMQVTLEAGCRLARDPRDPTGRSTDENGVCFQIDQRGWALPLLAGVTHQTVVGFLSTGSEGGSVAHAIQAQLVALRFVDGTGAVHEASAAQDPTLFAAAGVSLGLLGIITSVTLQCCPRYDILGEESTGPLAAAEVDLFDEGERGLARFLERTEYARLLWWPQPGVDKLVVWKARRMRPEESAAHRGADGALRRAPYLPFPPLLGSTVPMQFLAGAALGLLGNGFDAKDNPVGDLPRVALPEADPSAPGATRPGPRPLRTATFQAFVSDTKEPQRFVDTWWQGLPLDNIMREGLLPTTFTEIFLPLRHAAEAMRRLRALYAARGFAASGNFVVEIYAARASRFLLSPAHGEDMLRLNLFWFERNPGDPRTDYFPQFWGLLADLGFRLHWGKLLFRDGETSTRYLAPRYPGWAEFFRLRERLDPDQVFVSSYWRRHLGIALTEGRPLSDDAARTAIAPLPPRRQHTLWRPPAREFPLLFRFAPGTAEDAARAAHVIDHAIDLEAPAEEAFRVLGTMERAARWMPWFRGARFLTDERLEAGAVHNATFTFMTLQLRVVSSEPGRGMVCSVDACSLPLARRMTELVELSPLGPGRCRLRWRVCYDVPLLLQPLRPLLHPIFSRLFRESTRGLAAYLRSPRPAGLLARGPG